MKDGEQDSWLELKDNQSDNEANERERRRRVGALQIMQIQDEIDYIISNLDHIVDPHIAILRYNRNRKILLSFMWINLIFDVALNIYIGIHF